MDGNGVPVLFFATVYLCPIIQTQVAILTLLEGDNARLELKAGDDAAKARCLLHLPRVRQPTPIHPLQVGRLPARAPHVRQPRALHGGCNQVACSSLRLRSANYLIVLSRRLVAKGVVNADGQVI